MNKYQRGQQVEVNGVVGRVLDYYSKGMVNVRIFDGLRHVGDVCVDEAELKPVKSMWTPERVAREMAEGLAIRNLTPPCQCSDD